jgi:hypothetical protein
VKLPLDDGWARTIDALAKLLTVVAIILGGGWTLIQYTINRADQLRAQQLEASKPFLEKRLQFYIEATTAAATITTSKNPDEVAQAKQKFWMLYSGPLIVLAEPAIQRPLNAYADCLESSAKCQAPLPQLSRELARAAGVSMGNQWSYPNPPSLKAEVQ